MITRERQFNCTAKGSGLTHQKTLILKIFIKRYEDELELKNHVGPML